MDAFGAVWDEDRGGPRTPYNFISIPTTGDFYKATAQTLPWRSPGAHDDEAVRQVIASIYIEQLFRRAPVPNPPSLDQHRFLTKSLGIDEYLNSAMELLLEEGLVMQENVADEHHTMLTFACQDDLVRRADEIITNNIDNPVLEINDESFEWLEGHGTTVAETTIDWFHAVTMAQITARMNNLQVYIELAHAVGPRSTVAERTSPTSTFNTMVGGAGGGQLIASISVYYYGASNVMPVTPVFLAPRIADFFADSQWPIPYQIAFNSPEEYLYDLPRRATAKTASRQEWLSIVLNKLPRAMRVHLPTLYDLFQDVLDDPHSLVRHTQAVGDALLPGNDRDKLPLWKIESVEEKLDEYYGGFVRARREEGHHTHHILKALWKRLSNGEHVDPSKDTHSAQDDAEARGPKPGQLARARAHSVYTQMETKYLPVLENHLSTTDQKLCMMGEIFMAPEVLGKAVLLATKGARMTPYIGSGASNFLCLLHDERHLMRRFIGQSLAYDEGARFLPPLAMRTCMRACALHPILVASDPEGLAHHSNVHESSAR